jgi:hypothetical protein
VTIPTWWSRTPKHAAVCRSSQPDSLHRGRQQRSAYTSLAEGSRYKSARRTGHTAAIVKEIKKTRVSRPDIYRARVSCSVHIDLAYTGDSGLDGREVGCRIHGTQAEYKEPWDRIQRVPRLDTFDLG